MIFWLAIFGFGLPLAYYLLTVRKEKEFRARRLDEIQRRLKKIEEASSKKDNPGEEQ